MSLSVPVWNGSSQYDAGICVDLRPGVEHKRCDDDDDDDDDNSLCNPPSIPSLPLPTLLLPPITPVFHP